MNNSLKFAAFIMTYRRNIILEETIKIIFDQTIIPQKVLIVDNDPDEGAKTIIQNLSHLPIAYHAIGYNSGPAGAAKAGLEILSKEGYDWIGWIDDDDPPLFKDTYETLFKRASEINKCGSVGAVGQRFDISKAKMIRVFDEELDKPGNIYVDNIAGGMCKIVNAEVVKNDHILPDEKLFYGFEELDFDLRVKKAGYTLIADAELYKKNRIHHNRIGFKVKRGQKKETNRLWREYYSTRNLLIILHKQRAITSLILFLSRCFLKSLIGFRYGLKYGLKNFRFINTGILHFIAGRKGKL